jgi:mono/diheme cytochrome c family protein/plastocyanin
LVAGLIAYFIWEPERVEDAEARQIDVQLERGAKLFANNCAVCHGLQGEGFVGPPLNVATNRPTNPQELTLLQSRIRNTITCGRVGTFMPAWARDQGGSLNNDQIQQLVLLITESDEEAWEFTHEYAEEHEVQTMQPSPDQINQGACGQVLRETTPATPGPSPDPQLTWDVAMRDNLFDPRSIAVPAGQRFTIALRNDGTAIHNMRIAGPDNRYQTPDDIVSTPEQIRGGQRGDLSGTITQTGTFNFRCDFHPTDMIGSIAVK